MSGTAPVGGSTARPRAVSILRVLTVAQLYR